MTEQKVKTHIITGATGFLGNNLVREFLARGDNLILFVRSNKTHSAQERAVDILKLTRDELDRVKVFDVDILLPLGEQVAHNELVTSFGSVDDVWHLAANLSFRFAERDKTISTNVYGSQQMAELAKELDTRLFYFSTAYMHGRRHGELKEADVIQSTYNNPYEESKYLIEKYLQEQIKSGLKCTVFRPAILFDATPYHRQGHVSGYYVLLLSLWNVSRGLTKFVSRYKFISKVLGLRIESDGALVSRYIPFTSTHSRMNLISIQDALEAIFNIYDRQEESLNNTYHIVSPEGIPIKDVIGVMFETYNVRIRIVAAPKWVAKATLYTVRLLGGVFNMFAGIGRKMRYYEFYLINTQQFDLTNVYAVIPKEEYNKMFSKELEVLRIASKSFIKLW